MDASALSSRRFGPFELNPLTGELRKNGIRLKLPNQAFRLLWLLTDRPGQLVTRDEIRLGLWPHETVVEWEHSINTAMKRIRAALGDVTTEPVYIETLRGRGYRFIGQVEACPIQPSTHATAMAPVQAPSTDSETPEPLIASGGQVSHYRIVDVIGKGGMGIVYRAEDLRLGRDVALKFLSLDRVADPMAMARFEREARTASMLNHPNICTIYDIEIETSGAFIAMELLEGETLRDRIHNASVPFSTLQLLELGVQVADALDAAHERNIIHRDIKPANIFLTKRGEAKVLDFGLAKPAPRRLRSAALHTGGRESSSENLTSNGAAPGTIAYMSPEQARGEELDSRTDLYSFGAVLHEVATGRQAFQGMDSALPPAEIAKHPPKLWELMSRLLERDRDLRYQSAADVASELRRLKRDISGVTMLDGAKAAPTRPNNGWMLKASVAAASALALLFASWLLWGRRDVSGPFALPEILTSDPGNQVAGDFSPDGKQVVYAWNGVEQNNYDLYALTIGHSRPLRLTTDPDLEYSPAWSPDGKLIAFLKGPSGGVAALMLMPSGGGPARKLCDTSMRVAPQYRRIVWSPDSRWIVMEGEPSGDADYALAAVSVPAGERHKLTYPATNQGDLQPAISPDGMTLAFIKDVGNGVAVPYLLPIAPTTMTARGSPQRLHLRDFEKYGVSSPRWLYGGHELIFGSSRGGPGRLWRAPVDGSSDPILLHTFGDRISFPAVSRDGKRLLFSRYSVNANIWSASVEAAGGSPSLVGATPTDSVPDFSPDGSAIAFDSERSGFPEIWVADRNGGSPRQLTNYGGPVTGSARWSPDGKWIAYDSRVDGQPDIYRIPSAGGTAQRLTSDPAADIMPFWSPDGRWIYFCSGRSGSRELWRLPSHGGLAEQITKTGGCAPRITPDGKTIYYMKRSGPIAPIWRVPAGGGDEVLVVNNVVDRCFAVSGGRLYFVAQPPEEPHPSLRYMDRASGKVTVVRTLTGTISATIAVAPEGTAVLYRQVAQAGSNLMLVDNFH